MRLLLNHDQWMALSLMMGNKYLPPYSYERPIEAKNLYPALPLKHTRYVVDLEDSLVTRARVSCRATLKFDGDYDGKEWEQYCAASLLAALHDSSLEIAVIESEIGV